MSDGTSNLIHIHYDVYQEAIEICEQNLECAGFTFQGSLDGSIESEIFFFFLLSEIEDDMQFWDWSTYVVNRYACMTQAVLGISLNRNFVALQGYFQQKMHRINTSEEDLLSSSLLEICINSPYCEGISKDEQNSFFQYEKILIERFVNDSKWTTVLPLNLALLKNRIRSGYNYIVI